jgi:hypothetical protein
MNGTDLAWQSLRSIGARALQGDADALEVARHEALLPGRAQPLVAALARTDPAWVVAHAETIARANPNAAAALLVNLQGSGHDLAALGSRVAPLADSRFPGFIDQFVDDGEAKRAILAAYRTAQGS